MNIHQRINTLLFIMFNISNYSCRTHFNYNRYRLFLNIYNFLPYNVIAKNKEKKILFLIINHV